MEPNDKNSQEWREWFVRHRYGATTVEILKKSSYEELTIFVNFLLELIKNKGGKMIKNKKSGELDLTVLLNKRIIIDAGPGYCEGTVMAIKKIGNRKALILQDLTSVNENIQIVFYDQSAGLTIDHLDELEKLKFIT